MNDIMKASYIGATLYLDKSKTKEKKMVDVWHEMKALSCSV